MSKHSVRITSIYCNASSEPNLTDGDEVYLICQADGGIPIRIPAAINSSHNMKAKSSWSFDNLILKYDYEVLVTLWDHDVMFDPNTATYLQSNEFISGTIGGASAKQLKNLDGADYMIYYTYLS